MKTSLIAILLGSCLMAADRGYVIGSRATPTATMPASAESFHIDGRGVLNFATATTNTFRPATINFGGTCNIYFRNLVESTVPKMSWDVAQCFPSSGGGAEVKITMSSYVSAGITDFVWRITYDQPTLTARIEVWSATGTNYLTAALAVAAGTATRSGTLTLAGETAGTIGFLRWYSGSVAAGSNPPKLAVPSGGRGDVINVDFDDSITDTAVGAGHPIAISGSGGTYADMPTYAPTCSASSASTDVTVNPLLLGPVLRAGVSNTLNGSGSAPNDGGLTLTYSWFPISWPANAARPVLTGDTSAPTLSGLVFGQYDIGLRVTDSSGGSSTCSAAYGAVATDNNSVVVSATAPSWWLPQIKQGSSVWADIDAKSTLFLGKQAARLLGTLADSTAYNPDWDTSRGVATFTNGSTAVNFVSGDALTTMCSTGRYLVAWTNSGANRAVVGVPSLCNSGVLATLSSNWTGTTGNYTWSYTDCEGCWAGQSGNNNYYDLVLGLYMTYWRTGQTAWLTAARTLADRWWRSPWVNQGTASVSEPPPRIQAKVGLLVYGADMRDNAGDGGTLFNAVDTTLNSYYCNSVYNDNREWSMNCSAFAVSYLLQPAGATARKATIMTILQNALTTLQNNRQTSNKSGSTAPWWGNLIAPGGSWNGNISGTFTVTNGSTSFTVTGGGGAWPIAPGQAVLFCTTVATVITCDAQAYVIATSSAGSGTLTTTYNGVTRSETTWSRVDPASSGVAGFGQLPFIGGIIASAMGYLGDAFDAAGDTSRRNQVRGYLEEMSTWLYIEGLDHAGYRGVAWGVNFPTCYAPVTAIPKCTYGDDGGRNLASEIMGAMAKSELLTPSLARRAQVDNFVGAKFGKTNGACPDCDGTYEPGLYDDPSFTLPGKWNGFYFGPWAAQHSWDAARLGGVAPASPVEVNLSVGPSSGETAAPQIVYSFATGAQSTVTCTAGDVGWRCPVTSDTRSESQVLAKLVRTYGAKASQVDLASIANQ